MGPFVVSYCDDGPWPVDEAVPRGAAVVEDVVGGSEDPVQEPVVVQDPPDCLDQVQLWRVRRKWDEGDVASDDEGAGLMASGVVEQDDGVRVGGDMASDLRDRLGHRLGDAAGYE